MRWQEKLTELGLLSLTEQQLLGDLRESHSCFRVLPQKDRGEFFPLSPDGPQNLVWCVWVRLPGGWYRPEQTAWRHSWIFHPLKTQPWLTISSADGSPAPSSRLDWVTSRRVSQPLQNLNWLGFSQPLALFFNYLLLKWLCVWKSRQHCQKAYPTTIKAFTNDIHKILLLFFERKW